MSHKLLLADDSLTIQKVIRITFEGRPFELEICSTAEELSTRVSEVLPRVVLLDFSLSDTRSGYDLCSMVKRDHPSVNVIILFGTFDSIDQQALQECGAFGHVVKPFDSTRLIEIAEDAVSKISNPQVHAQAHDADATDPAMVLDQSDQVEVSLTNDSVSEQHPPIIGDSDADWEMEVPGKIDQASSIDEFQEIPRPIDASRVPKLDRLDDDELDEFVIEEEVDLGGAEDAFPGVIGTSEDEIELEASSELNLGASLPSDEDLEYPDAIGDPLPAAGLPSEEDLEYPEPIESESSGGGLPSEEDLEYPDLTSVGSDVGLSSEKRLEEMVKDEVDEDLWKEDEIGAFRTATASSPAASQGTSVTSVPAASSMAPASASQQPIDGEEFEQRVAKEVESRLKAMLPDAIKQALDDLYSQSVDQVAWEVIPDIAENAINRELKSLRDTVERKLSDER